MLDGILGAEPVGALTVSWACRRPTSSVMLAGLDGPAEDARGDDREAGAESVDGAVPHEEREAAEATAVIAHDEVPGNELHKHGQSNFTAMPNRVCMKMQSTFRAMPFSMCRIAWPVRPAAAAQRQAWPLLPN